MKLSLKSDIPRPQYGSSFGAVLGIGLPFSSISTIFKSKGIKEISWPDDVEDFITELNIIVKADVDGSSEALADSLLKLSTPEVQVNVIHKSVGAISESDILLASASNAIIVGFNVRPTLQARRLAEKEEIDIRLYSIIYTAIEEIKSAIEGMLAPEIEEVVTCNIEIREVFNISKVGRIAGCMVLDGKVNRQTKIRIIRDGIVVHTGSCLLYTSPSPRDPKTSRMPSSA